MEHKALYNELKNKLKLHKGPVKVMIDADSIKCKTEGDSWKELISLKPESPLLGIPVPLHLPKDSYKLQFKADEQSKANRTEAFAYNVTINHAKSEDVEGDNLIPEKMSLRELAKWLYGTCKVSEEQLFSALAQLDIGTFQMDIARDDMGSPFSITRIYQSQAVSQRKDDKNQAELDAVKLTGQVEKLNGQILSLSAKLKEREQELRDVARLQLIEKSYNDLRKTLGLNEDKQDKERISLLSTAGKRESVMKLFQTKISYFVESDLKKLDFSREEIGLTIKKIEDTVSAILSKATEVELDKLLDWPNANPPKKLKDVLAYALGLFDDILLVIMDRILYAFSSSERRQTQMKNEAKATLSKYDLELFTIELGTVASIKESRFVSVRESGYVRGACVETLSPGLRRLGSGLIIYKADIVISS
ncbi:MAG: hypothetical protein PHG34_02365 [Candidatus Cloacimonetes bacterium]|nr:hypothetical protein [Candidatus Cloacimonadota bacterium]